MAQYNKPIVKMHQNVPSTHYIIFFVVFGNILELA